MQKSDLILPALFILIIVLLAGIIFWVMYTSTVGHEKAHVAINTYFGMDSNYVVNVGWDGISGLTTPDANDSFYSEEARNYAYLAHGINEAIGYQLRPYFIGILIFLMFITIILFLNTIGGNSNGESYNRRKTTERERNYSDGIQLPSA